MCGELDKGRRAVVGPLCSDSSRVRNRGPVITVLEHGIFGEQYLFEQRHVTPRPGSHFVVDRPHDFDVALSGLRRR